MTLMSLRVVLLWWQPSVVVLDLLWLSLRLLEIFFCENTIFWTFFSAGLDTVLLE